MTADTRSLSRPLAGRSPAPRTGGRSARLQEALAGYSFAAPNLVLIGLFLLYPVVSAVLISLRDARGFGDGDFIGLGNYARLLSDAAFWQSTANTVLFTAITVPLSMALGLGLAVLMNSVLPARGLFRTIIVLPMVVSGVATALVGVLIFDEGTGILNKLLRAIGGPALSWQSGGAEAFASVVIITLWVRVGFNMVIYLAGLQGVSPELYESARLDGANAWQQFRNVTLPLVGPSTFFLLVMNVIYSFQVFDIIFVMTGGGPGYSTSVLVTYAYQNGFVTREQGYAAALGIVLLIITLVFTALYWRASRARDLTD
ncbi:carbohydrate ABC transporter permease [Desertivibrio insolitus]|uniref:carbohydrate ABC transporter permease n=1 Tax=Herbiconiux sp. SYSU D00978 TaxID=2812562 RepID=UPI001A96946A|nr:sugar ABC transporter permease [Herbiconiux sp. SYSU D00978]